MEQIKDIIKSVANCLAEKTSHMDSLDANEFAKACDGIKDLSMSMYYCSISEAMEKSENQYGRDYDEYGKKYYSRENRMTPEMYRDMDMPTRGRMYYTETRNVNMPETNQNVQNVEPKSRYDVAKKYYTDTKAMNPDDKQNNVQKLDAWMQEVKSDVMELASQMSNEEKTMAKRRVQELASMIV